MKKTGCKPKINLICCKCNQAIDVSSSDRYCSLSTFEKDKVIEVKWFHLKCYIEWFNKNVENKAMQAFHDSMTQTLGKFKPFLNNMIPRN